MRDPGGDLMATFSRAGVHIRQGKAWLEMRWVAVGTSSQLLPVRATTPEARTNRVTFERGNLVEWWTNTGLGLEQGFELAKPPARSQGPLTLALRIGGSLRAIIERGHKGVDLLGAGGGVVIRYSRLAASDARDHPLHSWLELHGSRLLLRVNAERAAYPVTIDPVVQAAALTASDGQPGDGLGNSMAMSGSTVVAGAPQAPVSGNSRQGAVYVFTKPASGWTNATQVAKLTASDGSMNERLGFSVGVSDSTIVAGAEATIAGRPDQGAIYVFTKPASGWANATQAAKLTASDGAAYDDLGLSVAIAGDTVVAGAPKAAIGGLAGVGSNNAQGAVYLFTKPVLGWTDATQSAKLTASDGASSDDLGQSVAVSGATVVAGAPEAAVEGRQHQGAAYVFREPPLRWADSTQTVKLTALDGSHDDALGYSVAVSGTTIVAGSPGAGINGHARAGALYAFTAPGGDWRSGREAAKLTASDGASMDNLGSTLTISGSSIVAGTPYASVGPGANHQGAAYLFTEPPGGWVSATQTAKLVGTSTTNDFLGYSVATNGADVVTGAPFAPASTDRIGPGVAYVFLARPAASAPHLSGVFESARRWRIGTSLPQVARRRGAAVGTTFGFTLDVTASVTFDFRARLSGRAAHGRCRMLTRRTLRRRACRRVRAATLRVAAHAGLNTVRFEGRLPQGSSLRPGHYEVALTAVNAVGASDPAVLSFIVVAGRHTRTARFVHTVAAVN